MLPTITHGIIIGIAAIIGLPVIINEVIGVITERATAYLIPAVNTQSNKQALIIGPVM